VIVVGAGTVRAEGYGGIRLPEADATWRLANGLAEQPQVAIVSSRLELDPAHPFFARAATRPIVLTCDSSPEANRRALAEVADVLVCGSQEVDPREMVAGLAALGHTQVLCEGGPHLFGSLVEADCVDELCLTLSPVLEGGTAGRIAIGHSPAPRTMTLLHAIPAGDLVFLRYARRESGAPPAPV
jgi:riboflavin biosynthesis pyrimidine reductase